MDFVFVQPVLRLLFKTYSYHTDATQLVAAAAAAAAATATC
jgi:hypothetical protein